MKKLKLFRRAQASELDYIEALQREREDDVQDIRRLAHEINLTAQYQARKLQETSEEIGIELYILMALMD